MPDRIVAERALYHLDQIIRALAASHDRLSTSVQSSVEQLYQTMLVQCAAARFNVQQGAAVVEFLEGLDAIPEVRAAIGPLIDATKGRRMRGTERQPSDPALLDRLPPSIGPDRTTRSAPPPQPSPQPVRPSPPAAVPPQPSPAIQPRDPGSFPGPISPEGVTRGGEAHADSAKAAEAPSLTRYPELEFLAEVVIGMRTSLIVGLLLEPPDLAVAPVMVADTTPDRLPEVEVVVRVRGFDVVGSNTQPLAVSRDDDSDVRFVLIPRVAGAQTIRVDFYQNDRRIGSARCATTVVAQPSAVPPPVTPSSVEPLDFASADAAPPEIELCVETDPQDERVLYFTLHSSSEAIDYHHAPMGTTRLLGTPLEKMQLVYAELSELAATTPADPDEADYQKRRLSSLGRQLWDELFPNDLKAAYWSFRDTAQALLITSDEPWIPWEMIKPYRFDEQDERLDEPHLCEQFNVARWLSGPGMAEKMPIRRIRPVAPLEVNLPSVRAELDYLEQLNTLRPELLPDVPYNDRNRVIDLFENGAFNVLHIAAHGSFDAQLPGNSGISLTGGALRPSDLAARFGGKRPRPLVFINACHGARAEYSFTGLGGWADRLVRNARIGAFVGASWEVDDQLALRFAEIFYTALLRDGKTIGESFRLARQTIRDAAPANSTWLAYVLYADPQARAIV